MSQAMKVRGVGKKAQEVTEEIHAPGRLETGHDMTFRTPVVPDSDIPALLGIRSLENLEAIIDCRRNHRRMYLGTDTTIQAAASTTTLQLYPAMSGHLMLPITHYETATTARTATTQPLHLQTTETPATGPQQATDGKSTKKVQFQ